MRESRKQSRFLASHYRAASQNRSKSAQVLRKMAAAVFIVLECPDVSTVSGALGTCDLNTALSKAI